MEIIKPAIENNWIFITVVPPTIGTISAPNGNSFTNINETYVNREDSNTIGKIYMYWRFTVAPFILWIQIMVFSLILASHRRCGKSTVRRTSMLHTTKYFINLQVTQVLYTFTLLIPRYQLSMVILNNSLLMVMFLTMIMSNFDRYLAICYPFRYNIRVTTRLTLLLITASWLVAAIYGTVVGTKENTNEMRLMLNSSTTALITFSIVCLTYSNIIIWRVAKKQAKAIARSTIASNVGLQSRKRIHKSTKTCLLIVATFVVLWTPFLIRNMMLAIMTSFSPHDELTTSMSPQTIDLISRLVAMVTHLNPLVDPIIFVVSNARLRQIVSGCCNSSWFILRRSVKNNGAVVTMKTVNRTNSIYSLSQSSNVKY